jgi:hypothetical protein
MALVFNGSNNTIGGLAVGGLPDGVVDNDTVAAGAIDSAEMAAGAVDLAHHSASGTKSGTTFLAGDNTWKAAGGITSRGMLRAGHTGGNTSVSNNTQTEITSLSDDGGVWYFDYDNWYDPSTGRYTPQVAGYYWASATIQITGGNGTSGFEWNGAIRKNGSATYSSSTIMGSSDNNGWAGIHASGLFNLNGSSDYLSLFAYVYGAAGSVRDDETFLCAHLVHAT